MSKANLSRLRSDPVRIAAFCFKNLKRTEVLDTDISSAVGAVLAGVSCKTADLALLASEN
ncbi:hypothetical protein JHK82_053017 [Glycine max]|nr:hypothetical protein JHK86_052862 [Glycine max]KAG4927234.1 hypothetical protein JHK85_053720 [Glycine max]KAG5082852.1 hypothetical protein JHK84_052890 [Glycine max]KAG5085620.1 hypothetical protein JHK82_053017 [Glycine max]